MSAPLDAAAIACYQAPADLLTDKIILVTGAGAGIGRAVSIAYAAHGATVILLDRVVRNLERVYDEIEAGGGPQAAILPLNLESASVRDYEQLADTIDEQFGRLDGVLNNAAWMWGLTSIRNQQTEHWMRTIAINLHAPFLLTRACLPLLERTSHASLLFSTDACTRAYWGAYGVAKRGMEGLIEILADELDSDRPIRVNGIDTGPVRTGLRTQNYPGENPNTLPRPEDVTGAYLYFMGRDSADVSGHNVRLPRDS